MYTLLPYKGYMKSGECMRTYDLKTQLWTVTNVLKGHYNGSMIPGMWKGHVFQLVCYGLSLSWQLQQRADKDYMQDGKFIAQYRQITDSASRPPWVGDPWVHRSHRARLLGRAFGHYKEFFPGNPMNMPTIWPKLDDSDSRGYRLYVDAGDAHLLSKNVWHMPEELRLGKNREVLEA